MIGSAAMGINPLVGAGIEVGSSIIGSLFQGIANRRQNHRMVEFWKMNNEYNHPSAQMARLREAGLNPALMYGQNASGAAGNSSAPVRDAGAAPLQIGNPMEAYQNTKLFKLQSDNLRAQNTVLQNNAAQSAAKTAETLAKTRYLSRQEKEKLMMLSSRAQQELMKANYLRQNWELDIIEPEQMSFMREKKTEALLDKYALQKQNLSNAEKLGNLRDLERELKAMNLDFYQSQAILGMAAKILGLPQFR